MIFYRGISSDLSQVRAAFEMLWMSAMGLLKARIGQCLIICSIVWGEWPQSQAGESFNPHLYKLSPHLPCPVRSLFKVTHSRRLSEKPGTWEHGSLISWWLSGFDRFHFDLQSLSPLNLFSMRSFAVKQTGFLDLSLRMWFAGISLFIGSFSLHLYAPRVRFLAVHPGNESVTCYRLG